MKKDGKFIDYVPEDPWERIALIPAKLRRRGLRWLLSRVGNELYKFFWRLVFYLIKIQRYLLRILSSTIPFLRRMSKDTLVAVYDLDAYPPSFDVCWFLVWADLERRRLGLSRMHTLFIPANEDLRIYNPGYDNVIDRMSRAWRFRNICVASADLVPSNSGVTVVLSRDHADALELIFRNRFPQKSPFTGEMPSLTAIRNETIASLKEMRGEWTGLRATQQGLRYARQWVDAHCGGRKPVVITFRQYGFDPERNSNIAEWVAFARGLDNTQFFPIFIPDTDASMNGQPECGGLEVVHSAAWNLGLRMAFYEIAYLNLLVTSGTLELCVLNPVCRYLFFKVIVPSSPLATIEHLSRLGFEKDTTPAFATPFQKWVWEDDTRDVIEREFALMVDKIEAATGNAGTAT